MIDILLLRLHNNTLTGIITIYTNIINNITKNTKHDFLKKQSLMTEEFGSLNKDINNVKIIVEKKRSNDDLLSLIQACISCYLKSLDSLDMYEKVSMNITLEKFIQNLLYNNSKNLVFHVNYIIKEYGTNFNFQTFLVNEISKINKDNIVHVLLDFIDMNTIYKKLTYKKEVIPQITPIMPIKGGINEINKLPEKQTLNMETIKLTEEEKKEKSSLSSSSEIKQKINKKSSSSSSSDNKQKLGGSSNKKRETTLKIIDKFGIENNKSEKSTSSSS